MGHQDTIWAVRSIVRDGKVWALSCSGLWQSRAGTGFEESPHKDYTIRLWDITDASNPAAGVRGGLPSPTGPRTAARVFRGSDRTVSFATFCPNGRHFIAASQDGSVSLWDIEKTDGPIRQLGSHGPDVDVRSIAVAADGRSAVSGGDDCKVRFWRLPASMRDVLQAVKDKDRASLDAALDDFGFMGPEDCPAFLELVRHARHEDPEIRRRVGVAILRLADLCDRHKAASFTAEHAPMLVAVLTAPPAAPADPAEQRAAARGAGVIGAPARAAVAPLCRLLAESADAALLVEAARALGRLGDASPACARALEPRLTHPTAEVRLEAARALERLGPEAVGLEAVLAALRAESQEKVAAALEDALLKKIETLKAADLASLQRLLASSRPRLVGGAANALGELGPAARPAVGDLRQAFRSAPPLAKARIAAAFKKLGPTAKEAAPDLADELAKLAPKATTPEMVAALAEAAAALAALDPGHEAIARYGVGVLVRDLVPVLATDDDLKKAMEQPNDRLSVRMLIDLGPPAVDPLIRDGLLNHAPSDRRPATKDLELTIARYRAYAILVEWSRRAAKDPALARALAGAAARIRPTANAEKGLHDTAQKLLKAGHLPAPRAEVYRLTAEEATKALNGLQGSWNTSP